MGCKRRGKHEEHAAGSGRVPRVQVWWDLQQPKEGVTSQPGGS